LIDRRDADLLALVQRHAADPWWEEVILLAAAHPKFSDLRREDLVRTLLDAGHIVLAGRCTVDAGARLPAPLRRTILQQLESRMKDPSFSPQERYAAGETLDELGWLPPDLDAWVHCPATADNGADLLAPKYPITNTQFARFVESDGYTNPLYWGGEESKGWRWRMEKHSESRGKEPITQPRFWDDVRFGRERRGYPVVDVSWYEASAFAAWLTALVQRVREGDGTVNATEATWVEVLVKAGVTVVRLPTEEEWERLAGGVADENRYPWDPPQGPATTDKEAILARANTNGSAIGGTSPVAMYPLGYSQPYKLADIAGNVACWTDTWDDTKRVIKGRTLCGGSWYDNIDNARCIAHNFFTPDNSDTGFGCWVVAPIGSDC
jgi:formylglycine-generating enzyme required for sulfatase activity